LQALRTPVPSAIPKDASPGIQPKPFTRAAERQARKAALSSFAGAVVDWYDFLLYGITAALVFNSEFFPNISPAMGTLAAFATFGVGFLFRPLGGVVFGHFGDRLGRKRMLALTVIIMGLATALIGLLPSFKTIGWMSPVLLVVLRAIQGFAVGGEWGGAALMAVESAPAGKKAIYSSGVQLGYAAGLILATGLVTLLTHFLGDAEFRSWGWRLPFLFSIVLVAVGYWVRASVDESPEFMQAAIEHKTARKGPPPIIAAIRQHPMAFLQIVALRLGENYATYIVTAFALSYGTTQAHLDRGMLLNVILCVGCISLITVPIFATIADRFGRRRVYITGSIVGVLCAAPFFMAMEQGSTLWIVVFAILLYNVAHDMPVSVQQPMFTELFGTEYRYSGAGVGYQIGGAVAGGLTPLIAASLVVFGNGSWYWVAAYVAGGCLVSGIVAAVMRPAAIERQST
jgi:MHS family shikimate/dehydroshikimate transporter-like MFS transporter